MGASLISDFEQLHLPPPPPPPQVLLAPWSPQRSPRACGDLSLELAPPWGLSLLETPKPVKGGHGFQGPWRKAAVTPPPQVPPSALRRGF